MNKYKQQFILALVFLVTAALGEKVDDLNGFKDCQKRFGFSKKLEKSLNAEEGGDSNNQEFQHAASQSVIQKELSIFYRCLSELSTCEELILASEEGSTQQKQIPIQECLQKCYNPNDFSTKFMKDLTEFSVNCAKSTLNIQVSFERQDDELGRIQGRIPWEIVSFGAVLSSFFVAWVNLKQIRIKLLAKKQGQQDSQGKSIYELNPDFIAHKAFQLQKIQDTNKTNNSNTSCKDEESLQDYQKEIATSDSLKENIETQKIVKQVDCQANLKESKWENKNNEQKGLLCGQDENCHSDYEDEFGGNEDPFDL